MTTHKCLKVKQKSTLKDMYHRVKLRRHHIIQSSKKRSECQQLHKVTQTFNKHNTDNSQVKDQL